MRRRPYDTVKRAIDLVVAWTLLIVTLPIQLVVALAVRLRMGSPVLFRQARPGRGGRVFEMVKFRTMLVEDETHVTDDERMTRLGALLSATSLDELPECHHPKIDMRPRVFPRKYARKAGIRFDKLLGYVVTDLKTVRAD